jgi:hypothetical protein
MYSAGERLVEGACVALFLALGDVLVRHIHVFFSFF